MTCQSGAIPVCCPRLFALGVRSAVVSGVSPTGLRLARGYGVVLRGTESLLTHRWRGMDSNVQFRARVGNGFRAHSATSGHVPTSGPMVRIRLAPARSQQSGRSSPACFRAGRELTQGQRIEISAIALAYLRPLFQASCSPERIRRSLIWERLFESGGTAR